MMTGSWAFKIDRCIDDAHTIQTCQLTRQCSSVLCSHRRTTFLLCSQSFSLTWQRESFSRPLFYLWYLFLRASRVSEHCKATRENTRKERQTERENGARCLFVSIHPSLSLSISILFEFADWLTTRRNIVHVHHQEFFVLSSSW